MKQLEEKLLEARAALESARGYAIWARAPTSIRDDLDESLFYLNKAARVASLYNSTFFRKENQTMKELFAMLDAYNADKSYAIATTERLQKVGAACEKANANLDAFFESAGMNEAPEGEAAPNGELGDGASGQEGADVAIAEGVV